MPYETFDKRRALKGIPMVSILQDGRISLNKACFTWYFEPLEYAILMFDKTTNKIGLKPTSEVTANTYRIRRKKDRNYAQIGGIAFLKFLGIPFSKTKAYPCHWNEEKKLVEFEVDVPFQLENRNGNTTTRPE